MFITSRESAIFPLLPPVVRFPLRLSSPRRLASGDVPPSITLPRAFGVLSIYQPQKAPAQSESAVFIGFFASFLDWQKTKVRRIHNRLWSEKRRIQLEGDTPQPATSHPGDGN